jgi:uncharacterized membrane protein
VISVGGENVKTILRRVALPVFAILIAASVLSAQTQSVPTAPKPIQILAAKKVFISNASGRSDAFYFNQPDQLYNEFYAALSDWRRFELTAAPRDADLVLEIHFTPNQDVQLAMVELVILDPSTRTVLWTLNEKIDSAAKQSTGRKNFDKAMSALMNDLKKLAPADAKSSEN